MRLPGIIAFAAAATLEAFALSTLAGHPPPNVAGLVGSATGIRALAIHGLSAALFALGGTLLTRRPSGKGDSGTAAGMFAFLFAFAITLPVVGVATGIIMVVLLGLRVHTDPLAERFTSGNPLLDRASIQGIPDVPAAEAAPLTAILRGLDAEQIPRLILGLKRFLPANGARAFLQRFQRDGSSQTRFYAQSALGDEIEALEGHLAVLRHRVECRPDNAAARFALAEILLHSGSLPGVLAPDRESQVRQALDQLRELPETPTSLLALTRAHLLLGDLPEARAALGRGEALGAAPPLVEDFRRELLFLERAWGALATDPARPLSPPQRAAIKFWQTNAA